MPQRRPYPVHARAQDLVDQHLSDRKEVPAMQAVLGGKFAQQVICRGVPFRSEKQDDFFQARARASALLNATTPCPAAPRALLPCAPLFTGAAPIPSVLVVMQRPRVATMRAQGAPPSAQPPCEHAHERARGARAPVRAAQCARGCEACGCV